MGCGQKAWTMREEEEEERSYDKECKKRFKKLKHDVVIPLIDRVKDYLSVELSTSSKTKQEFRKLEELIDKLEEI